MTWLADEEARRGAFEQEQEKKGCFSRRSSPQAPRRLGTARNFVFSPPQRHSHVRAYLFWYQELCVHGARRVLRGNDLNVFDGTVGDEVDGTATNS
jgi:hypothetical protein